jgi:hypothetical protein
MLRWRVRHRASYCCLLFRRAGVRACTFFVLLLLLLLFLCAWGGQPGPSRVCQCAAVPQPLAQPAWPHAVIRLPCSMTCLLFGRTQLNPGVRLREHLTLCVSGGGGALLVPAGQGWSCDRMPVL